MHWRSLGVAVSLYNRCGGVYPVQPLALVPETNAIEEYYLQAIRCPTAKIVEEFLIKWGGMGRIFSRSKIRRTQIQDALGQVDTIKARFMQVKLETLKKDTMSGLKDLVIIVFERFSDILRSPVAASKTLHILLPQFFVMWDRKIRIAYGCVETREQSDAEAYFKLLLRVQRELKDVVRLYSYDHPEISRAAEALKGELYKDAGKSLAKIVDEWNFMKYTRCKDQLWESR